MNEEFDDPGLKAAVKRVWGGETAPAELRAAVEAMLAERKAVKASSAGYAIAAGLLLAATLGTLFFCNGQFMPAYYSSGYNSNYYNSGALILPPGAAQSMAHVHDRASQRLDQPMLHAVAGDTPQSIARKIAGDIQIPVLAATFHTWDFAGAAESVVWGHPAGHFLYRQGDATLSVFSIPAGNMNLSGGDQDYVATLGDYIVAGFLKDGGLYCIVVRRGAGNMTRDDAIKMRDQLRQNFALISQSARAGNMPPALALALPASPDRVPSFP